jgi:hypothetical protein
MWMNEGEIDEMVEFTSLEAPEFAPYARYLSDWRDTVNSVSDGWHSWRAGAGCAEKLMEALQSLRNSHRYGDESPAEAAFKRALTPIKSFASKKNLTAPTLEPVQFDMRL